RALLHDIAELTGEDQPAAARYARGLDEQDVAADRRPGEPRGDARYAGAHRDLALEARRAEDRRQIVDVDRRLLDRTFGDAHRDVAQHRADHAFQVADAGLARVIACDLSQSGVSDLRLFRLEAVRFELAAHEVALRDLDLLLLGVTGELDHFHAVAQRPRDRVEHVRGG